MASPENCNDLQSQKYVLVTGANSGLGFSICCRLADEFLASATTSPSEASSLTIVFTTRSSSKGSDTLARLQDYLRNSSSSSTNRVTFLPENVDLSNLLSVRALSRRLLHSLPKLDAIILNAGLGGWTGIDWPRAIFGVCTDLVHEVSWPSFKIAPAGVVTPPQTKSIAHKEPRLGVVFCANVFGHYMLAHNVMALLRRSTDGGRVIWVSSLEATIKQFDIDDIQGLRTTAPYESSKALTDILALTADLPSTAPFTESFYAVDHKHDDKQSDQKPNTYVSHPGICGTAILPLSLPLFYAMLAAFYLARLLGSPWHNNTPYFGACAPVFLALAAAPALLAAEEPYRAHGGSRPKWGSATSRWGVNSAVSTEADGWGHGGVVGEAVVDADRERRRKRGAQDLTREGKEGFEELGRKCWGVMEELRVQWERILDEEEEAAAAGSA